jgi:hypothetical protein
MALACSGFVAKPTSAPIPASAHRSGSSAQDLGRYSSRSINARPRGEAYARNTPSWQFSTRPAVPEYCRCTPAERRPFFTKPVSSGTNTARESPRCSTT